MLDDAIREIPDFPKKLASELKHCIVAHHGELEYGSPKKPALAEAMALNCADNADAKMQTLTEIFKAKDTKDWLGYNRLFESNLERPVSKRSSERKMSIKMKKNDVVTVEVTDIGIGGEGIGKVDGYTLFIKDAVIGDTVEVKVMKAKKNYGYARLMRIVKESAFRVSARCPEARRCADARFRRWITGNS